MSWSIFIFIFIFYFALDFAFTFAFYVCIISHYIHNKNICLHGHLPIHSFLNVLLWWCMHPSSFAFLLFIFFMVVSVDRFPTSLTSINKELKKSVYPSPFIYPVAADEMSEESNVVFSLQLLFLPHDLINFLFPSLFSFAKESNQVEGERAPLLSICLLLSHPLHRSIN